MNNELDACKEKKRKEKETEQYTTVVRRMMKERDEDKQMMPKAKKGWADDIENRLKQEKED